ncbi:hypothetical protein QVG61_07230 [Thiohalobacter sp. IOR34]|uniref:hypothetical protein n=1 Tax=Thiohalobacter sp. IOR34 TaxID=3057176 RepID=UPI0025AFFB0F|nr:hypothetical protein [Thiohalobacter sp. IOR34]WJW74315.1 hypothetical protein QVG61_07230 [Thiohalobacter sp. IOR34]
MELDKAGGWPDSPEDLLRSLLLTKKPCIFAESAVAGDGSDWTAEEFALLGDIACLVPVTVFDDGEWHDPVVHEPPFSAHLAFVPGALLRDLGQIPSPDRTEVAPEGALDPAAYYRLYERRLVPVFDAIEDVAASYGTGAVVTVPGLGCGQFSGRFTGLHALLGKTLHRLLETHAPRWPSLRQVHYDPYEGTDNHAWRIGRSLVYRIRPLMKGRSHPPLSRVNVFEEGDDGFEGCRLFSLVAWDHVSWPGNDFYAGSRNTDDGVKAAATDSMYRMTGIEGKYDPVQHAYQPPAGFSRWEQVVRNHGIRLRVEDNLQVM